MPVGASGVEAAYPGESIRQGTGGLNDDIRGNDWQGQPGMRKLPACAAERFALKQAHDG